MTDLSLKNLQAMIKGLMAWSEIQTGISEMVPDAVDDEPSNDQVTRAAFGLTGEVFELAQELGWKNWKNNPEMTDEHKEVIAEEFADVMAFTGLMMVMVMRRTGLSVQDLAEAYFRKSVKNQNRFLGKSGEDGYEGFYKRKIRRMYENKEAG